MKTATVKIYLPEVTTLAFKVYEVTYSLKTQVINAVALINRKGNGIRATVTF